MAIEKGDRVQVKEDADGAVGDIGTVVDVFRSGRLLVQFDNGNLRNVKQEQVDEVSD